MALNFSTVPLPTKPNLSVVISKHRQSHYFLGSSSSSSSVVAAKAALSEGTESRGVAEEDPPPSSGSSSTRSQLDLLEQLTSSSGYESDGYSSSSPGFSALTIRDQLLKIVGERDDDFVIPLGKKNLKKISPKFLTISQKRNIKRQAYLDEVSQRNDSVFFATIGAFVILPPVIILGIAIATGYVQLFP
ncbi:OLC1v1023502C1 [Oldenlandia corymbosa var. corymbosa]|uniref:OLC1v1023502C1 n=1 Tax=Oldenlandia corymbosa var. corymbosa TaxID=529605 RepID=A0AAV1C0T5_OLDCO|nr:OLC1v1023502C1 [Oldenlandia corymbosa var. corymbosa]